MKQVSVTLIFDDAGYARQFSLRSGTQIDREFFTQLFSTSYFQRPPPNTKSVDLDLLIPSRNASDPSTEDLDRGDADVNNSNAPVSRPARPPLGYFQFLGDPVVRFTEAGHLDLTIKTNWTYEYAEPSIFLADEGAYSTNGVEYDPSLLNNLEIKFIDSQRSISIQSTVEVSRGKHWIILDIFTDRDSRYQRSIWFEAN